MKILSSPLYEEQLKEILIKLSKEDFSATKKFKMYLDTIILNMPTKVDKYKKSTLFDNDNIKEIEHEGFLILFYIDEQNSTYLILAIVENSQKHLLK